MHSRHAKSLCMVNNRPPPAACAMLLLLCMHTTLRLLLRACTQSLHNQCTCTPCPLACHVHATAEPPRPSSSQGEGRSAPAHHAAAPSPPAAAQTNKELLQSLGDPDKQAGPIISAGALGSSSSEWFNSVSSWVRQKTSVVISPVAVIRPLTPTADADSYADASARTGGDAAALSSASATAGRGGRHSAPALTGGSGIGAAAGDTLGGGGGTATASSTWGALKQYSR